MKQVTIRQTSAQLPDLSDEAERTRVDSLGPAGGSLARFELAGTRMRALDVKNVHLIDGRVRAVRAESADVRGLTSRAVEFDGCELGNLRWTGGKLSRTRFDGCKLLAARFENVTLDHVVFFDCKLDYAVLSQVRATGPPSDINTSSKPQRLPPCPG